MRFSILQKLTGLGGLPTGQVVGSGAAAAAVQQLLAELPELLLAAVLDAGSGEVLAGVASTRHYQPAAVAGPATAVVQQLRALLAAQGLPPAELHEAVLTLATQLHVLQLTADGQQLLYLAVDARDTNLAIARQLAATATAQLASQLPN